MSRPETAEEVIGKIRSFEPLLRSLLEQHTGIRLRTMEVMSYGDPQSGKCTKRPLEVCDADVSLPIPGVPKFTLDTPGLYFDDNVVIWADSQNQNRRGYSPGLILPAEGERLLWGMPRGGSWTLIRIYITRDRETEHAKMITAEPIAIESIPELMGYEGYWDVRGPQLLRRHISDQIERWQTSTLKRYNQLVVAASRLQSG